jgi:TRAP-type C4-dicarboxylate transport system permease small subunit
MRYYIRLADNLSRLGGVLAMLLLASAVLVVCQMILVRYVFGQSTIWQTEYTIYAVVGSTLLGSPYVLLRKGHVAVDLLPNLAGPRGRYWMGLLAALVSLAFCAVLAWSGWLYFWEAFSRGWRTETVWGIPLWMPLIALPLGMTLLCLQYLAELLRLHGVEP